MSRAAVAIVAAGLLVLGGCASTARQVGADSVEDAGERLTAAVEQAGAELREVVHVAGDRVEVAGSALVDRLGDRMDAAIDRVPAATQATADQARDLLDHLGEWWQRALAALVGAVAILAGWRGRRKRRRAERVSELVVRAIDRAGRDLAGPVRERVAAALDGAPDARAIRREIDRIKEDD